MSFMCFACNDWGLRFESQVSTFFMFEFPPKRFYGSFSLCKKKVLYLPMTIFHIGKKFRILQKSFPDPKKWQKEMVWLYWWGYTPAFTLRRYPTTACHGDFWLLGFPPGPVRLSLANLVIQSSLRETILMTGLVRTPSLRKSTGA